MGKFNDKSVSGNRSLKQAGLHGLGFFILSLGLLMAMGDAPAYSICIALTAGGGGGACGSGAPVGGMPAPVGSGLSSGSGGLAFGSPPSGSGSAFSSPPPSIGSTLGSGALTGFGASVPVSGVPAGTVIPATTPLPAAPGCTTPLALTQAALDAVIPAASQSMAQNNPNGLIGVAGFNEFVDPTATASGGGLATYDCGNFTSASSGLTSCVFNAFTTPAPLTPTNYSAASSTMQTTVSDLAPGNNVIPLYQSMIDTVMALPQPDTAAKPNVLVVVADNLDSGGDPTLSNVDMINDIIALDPNLQVNFVYVGDPTQAATVKSVIFATTSAGQLHGKFTATQTEAGIQQAISSSVMPCAQGTQTAAGP